MTQRVIRFWGWEDVPCQPVTNPLLRWLASRWGLSLVVTELGPGRRYAVTETTIGRAVAKYTARRRCDAQVAALMTLLRHGRRRAQRALANGPAKNAELEAFWTQFSDAEGGAQ